MSLQNSPYSCGRKVQFGLILDECTFPDLLKAWKFILQISQCSSNNYHLQFK